MDDRKALMYVPLAEGGSRSCRLKKAECILNRSAMPASGKRGILEEQEMQAPAAGSRILVVDDERPVADTLATVFRIHGYETQTAYSAEDAIELMAQWRPDLAVVDVMLPGMSGIDLAIVLKHDFPLCPVLLFSGSAHTGELLEEAADRGHSFEILAKPVHPQQILEMVSILLAAAIGGHSIRHSN